MVADGQVQSVGTGTVVGIDVIINVSACLGIGAIVPCIVVAGILVVGIVCAVVDCKVKGVDVCTG